MLYESSAAHNNFIIIFLLGIHRARSTADRQTKVCGDLEANKRQMKLEAIQDYTVVL